MNKSKWEEPKVIILSENERVEAEEYIEDSDHVYRSKDEVHRRFRFKSSLFWLRLTCFLGLIAITVVLILRIIQFFVSIIFSAIQHFKHKMLNRQIKSCWENLKCTGKIFLGLAVGVINPNWGKRLMSLFFSLKRQAKKRSAFA